MRICRKNLVMYARPAESLYGDQANGRNGPFDALNVKFKRHQIITSKLLRAPLKFGTQDNLHHLSPLGGLDIRSIHINVRWYKASLIRLWCYMITQCGLL